MEKTEKGRPGKLRNMATIYLCRGEEMLLLYRQGGRVVNNVWTGSAGGHFEEWELNDAGACVLRELKEELAVTEAMLGALQLRYVTLRQTKGEIRQNYYFFTELKEEPKQGLVSNEGLVRWFSMEETEALKMPFTAKFVVEHYRNVGRYTDQMYGGIADGEKVVFTEMREF